MKVKATKQFLSIYEALASEVRLKIIEFLSQKPMNIKELAQSANLSSAIMTMHVKKLEDANIIKTEVIRTKTGIQKICTLLVNHIEIDFPSYKCHNHYEINIPIGHYSDFQVDPPNGIAAAHGLLGYIDDPRSFLEPERVNAGMLWLGKGFVEYRIPNYLKANQQIKMVEITMEIASEYPGYNNEWPSDITFFINGIKVATWTSPGDFGGVRGRYTPAWWPATANQYGLLKRITIKDEGTYIDEERVSDFSLNQLDGKLKQWIFRMSVLDGVKNVGGLTLYGNGFGNYSQDICLSVYYE